MLSAIVVTYNASPFIEDCLGTFRQSVTCDHEIIVIDNNSSDATLDIVAARFPDAILIRNSENRGFASACNQGISASKGDLIFLLNPDTIVHGRASDTLVQFMNAHPKAGIVGPRVVRPDGSIERTCHHFPTILLHIVDAMQLRRLFPSTRLFGGADMTYWDYGNDRTVDWITGCALLIRREVFEALGLLDESFFLYSEETDLCRRANNSGWDVWYTSSATIVHYGGTASLSQGSHFVSNKTIIQHLFLSRYLYFSKHKGSMYTACVKCVDFCYFTLWMAKGWLLGNSAIRKERLGYTRAVFQAIKGRARTGRG